MTHLENGESFSISWLTFSRELPYLIAGNKNVPAEIPLTLTWPSRQRESHTKQTSLTARNFIKCSSQAPAPAPPLTNSIGVFLVLRIARTTQWSRGLSIKVILIFMTQL